MPALGETRAREFFTFLKNPIMYSFKSIAVNYTFHLPPRKYEKDEGDQIVIAKDFGQPIEFREHVYKTDIEANAEAVRKNPLFGTEIFEVFPEKEKKDDAPDSKTKTVAAKGKNEMIAYLIDNKLSVASDFTGKSAKEIAELALTLGITFTDKKG